MLAFVVGMPRSGTKLLRDLLNRHSEVAIFPFESHCFPYFHKRFERYGDITQRKNFAKFHRDFCDTIFYRRMKTRGIEFDQEQWRARLQGCEYRCVIQALFACYRDATGCRIVGDKTPDYITQIPLLSTLGSNARFIHIVRDPRDYALSMQKAWGKNVFRAAQRWKQQILKYEHDVGTFGVKHIRVKYEDLLEAPEQSLRNLCDFLDIAFDAAMLSLDAPSENLGDTRGARHVVSHNVGKWKFQMDPAVVASLESIAGNLMQDLGYATGKFPGDRDVSAMSLLLYRIQDGVNLFRFRMREEGSIVAALAQMRRAAIHSGIEE